MRLQQIAAAPGYAINLNAAAAVAGTAPDFATMHRAMWQPAKADPGRAANNVAAPTKPDSTRSTPLRTLGLKLLSWFAGPEAANTFRHR